MRVTHPARARRTEEISRLNPATEWHHIYRQLVLWEFPEEAQGGFQVAFYRPQAVPRMAAVLAGTGHIRADPERRSLDTAIAVFEVIDGGPSSPRGQKMVRLLRRLHDRPDILQEDMTYVLCALIVVPTCFIDRLGWRPTLPGERIATWRFWCELGRLIGVEVLPDSYDDAERRLDRYEATNLGTSADGRQLTELLLGVLATRTPRPLRNRLPEITSTLIDDPRFSGALGLPRPTRATRLLVRVIYTIRHFRQRLSRPEREPSFVPGQPVAGVYPKGYDLDDVGPRN